MENMKVRFVGSANRLENKEIYSGVKARFLDSFRYMILASINSSVPAKSFFHYLLKSRHLSRCG